MPDTHLLYERNFDTLLLDSLDFLRRSSDLHEVDDEGQAFARISITYSLLLLEAVANTCLEHLDLSRSVHDEMDRLPVLAKFDFYLRIRFKGRNLDRGSHYVEWLYELKRLRDGLVHLKPHKVEWIGDLDGSMSAESVRTKSLDIAVNPKFWGKSDAINVSRGVHGFLRYFFREQCRYGPTKVASLLFSESRVPGDNNHFFPCAPRHWKALFASRDVDLSYIKLMWV
ncbi:hypothetical protein SNE35_29960 [Paucibacter sp. R3-3]|uniref:HEPN AbiU2-like domain-containing protein n=1 Tax=Roseateles agri TaxID=3098619 RepID=A0ABU5DR18_9BURK|nr:hypothetical protein [Paucibacter sp. R3-3]MDY0748761.1 hypothetical protein [Paucibacter sp. R3-3]